MRRRILSWLIALVAELFDLKVEMKEHLNNCVPLMREMEMGLWLERAEADLKELG